MFSTGEGLLTQKDTVTSDGLQQVFATNLFGHFLLVSTSDHARDRNMTVSLTGHESLRSPCLISYYAVLGYLLFYALGYQ